MSARDPYLELPLTGVQLIEASAGTGKTFTLATLVTRLVVEQRLRIGQVLAVTYTEAATQELRKRIRERLQLALDICGTPPAETEDNETALTRQVLDAHLARQAETTTNDAETVEALRRRLHQAVLETDLAAIFTVHGFCARVLREHALESGHGFDAPELLGSDRDLRAELAADLWRRHAQDPDSADDLLALWKTHEALADDLDVLLSPVELLPAAQDLGDVATLQARLAHAADGLRSAWSDHGDDFCEALSAAIDAGVMNRSSYKPEWLADLRDWCAAFTADAGRNGTRHPKLEKLTAGALETGTKKDHKGKTPTAALTHEVAVYLQAIAALDEMVEQRRANLLHRLRDQARQRLALLKRRRRVQTYDDLIDGVADVLAGVHGEAQADALARSLRAQYRVALVDEFQDSDARQWGIFQHVFGSGGSGADPGAPALFLIGDPKQAIYGFRGGDVHTYLDAARIATPAPALRRNFRSRPSLLDAIAALYRQGGAAAFVDQAIRFTEVEPGGQCGDASYLRNGQPAPALTFWQAPATGATDSKGRPTAWSTGESRERATRACAAAIHGVLVDARNGNASIDDEPLRPGDIAVLVRTHHEATMIQKALVQLGIAAVAAGKQSLFATDEARDLHALLLALLHAGDEGRLRTALCTVLVGVDAAGIEALDIDGEVQRQWQQRAADWRSLLERAGPLALVETLCALNAPRLLGLLDGERRLSNTLQLAELLQEAQAGVLGLHGLVEWLAHRIATASAHDDTQLLRLESDAQRVQIITLHKSKGLEYPLVFLPFVGVGSQAPSPGHRCVVHEPDHGRRLHWKLDLPGVDWETLKADWRNERAAEAARLLYVGLTRAKHALWVGSGPFYRHDTTALAALLNDAKPGDGGALAGVGIVFDPATPPADLPRLPPESDAEVPAARASIAAIRSDWWVYSFSQLSRSDAAADTASVATAPTGGGNDEVEQAPAASVDDDYDPRFAGTRFGVALHAAFEHADFGAWRQWRAGDGAPAGQAAVIADALHGEGYAAGELEDGVALCTRLIGHTLTASMPEGMRLCDVALAERRPEIEFQFSLQPTRVSKLMQLLHAHGIAGERDRFGARQSLEGLMTGLIDLTYRFEGKWYVLDYKSNRLPGYDAAHLHRAMDHGEYDLQALIYTLALHRWLRFRLGDGYDYRRDFGGIRYLFCRGIDAAGDDAAGIHAQRFEPELVDALDALFGCAEGVAA